jgi:hypothetical protein
LVIGAVVQAMMVQTLYDGETSMKPHEVFGIIVRAAGLLLLLMAVRHLCAAIINLALGGPTPAAGFFSGIPEIIVSLWLLRGAKCLVSFAFPEEAK